MTTTADAPASTEAGGGEAESGEAVTMAGIAFAPDSLEVAVGTEVTWTNEDSATHTVTADDGSFDSGEVEQDGTFSQTFDEAGTYAYVCTIHAHMAGEVVVS